jgi:hypothetical protein
MHDSVISGHFGKTKTKEKLSQRYYWYEMREDIWITFFSVEFLEQEFICDLQGIP